MVTTSPAVLALGIIFLASILTITLAKDVGRALRWLFRTLFRLGIACAILGLAYALIFVPYR